MELEEARLRLEPFADWRSLLPEGYTVVEDVPFDAPVDLAIYPAYDGCRSISGKDLREAAADDAEELGQMAGFQHLAALLHAREQGVEIPAEWLDLYYLVVPGTVFERDETQYVAYITVANDEWEIEYDTLDGTWDSEDGFARIEPATAQEEPASV